MDNQEHIIKALASPSLYPGNLSEIQVQETALSVLYITPKRVYKLKKAIKTPKVDFSTPLKRKGACLHEMQRSAIYAPQLVIGLKPVKLLKNGRIKIGGMSGEEVDTVLVMRRLPEEMLLDAYLPNPAFGAIRAMQLAKRLVALHGGAKVFRSKGGWEVLAGRIETVHQILKQNPQMFPKDKVNVWYRTAFAWLNQHKRLIQLRQKSGRFRKCHGNLFLSNIGYTHKDFLFFSPIEYDTGAECIDVLYDLAALLIDLERKGLRLLGNKIFNTYLTMMNDYEGLPLLPFYQSLRAMTRATAKCEQDLALAKVYFDLACQVLTPYTPELLITDQEPEKNWIQKTGPAPGGLVLKDALVKGQITGFSKPAWFSKTYGVSDFYKIVYDILEHQAGLSLNMGISVAIQLTHPTSAQKKQIRAFAEEQNVPISYAFSQKRKVKP